LKFLQKSEKIAVSSLSNPISFAKKKTTHK